MTIWCYAISRLARFSNSIHVQTNLQNTEDITNIVDSTAIENSTESLASVLEETTLAAAIEMAVDTVTDSSSGQIKSFCQSESGNCSWGTDKRKV